MKNTEIGDKITVERGLQLCEHFGYKHLAGRLKENPNNYKDWIFDGASMVPNKLFSRLFRIPNLTKIALKHDLKYAYGEKGNKTERLRADLEFTLDILNDGASPAMAKLILAVIDNGGAEKLNTSYSWAYAHI